LWFQGIGADSVTFGWTEFTCTEAATSASTAIEFSGRNPPADWRLDDVSVTDPASPVPEPTTLAIWSVLGGVGLAVGKWRKREAA
jgi:hypothetical protein